MSPTIHTTRRDDKRREEFTDPLAVVKDYLILLGAFHTVQSLPDFGKIAEQGAMQYQIWAQMMLPYYFERRVERSKGIRARYQRSTGGEFMHRIDTVLDHDHDRDRDRDPMEPIMGGVITSSPTVYGDMESWPRRGNEDEDDITHSTTARSTTDTDATLVDEVQEDGIQFLPPLPVLMAWHAHILNSTKYEQEVGPDGAYSALRDYPFPLREAVSLLLPHLHSFLVQGFQADGVLGTGHIGWDPT